MSDESPTSNQKLSQKPAERMNQSKTGYTSSTDGAHIAPLTVNAGSHLIRRVATNNKESGTGTPFFAYPTNQDGQSAVSVHGEDDPSPFLVVRPSKENPDAGKRLMYVVRR